MKKEIFTLVKLGFKLFIQILELIGLIAFLVAMIYFAIKGKI